MNVTGGVTDVTTYFQLINVADGTDATGLTITDFDLSYTRSGAATAAKVDATALAAADSAHADNKMIEVDATDCPGLYRVDWPDAAFAAGVPTVALTVKHADIQTTTKEVSIDTPVDVTRVSGDSTAADNLELDYDGTGYAKANSTIGTATAVTNEVSADVTKISGDGTAADNLESACDNYSATRGLAGTALPAAAADAAGGLVISDAGALDIDAALAVLTAALAELAADPGATPTLSGALMLLYMALRNEGTSTALARTIKNNAGATVLTASLADTGVTFTKGKFA